MSIRRSVEEIKNIVKNLNFIYINEYRIGYIQKVVISDKTGYKYDVVLSSLMTGNIPFIVHKTNPFSLENIILWLKLNYASVQLYDNSYYYGNKELLKFYCSICDDYFYMSWDNIYHGIGCSVCAGKQVGEKHSFGYFYPELINEWSDKNIISPFDVPVGFRKTHIIWECPTCGYEWKCHIRDRIKSKGCKACSGEIVTYRNSLLTIYPNIAE